MTFGSYVAAGTKEAADAKAVLTVIEGGKADDTIDDCVETIEQRIVSTPEMPTETRVNSWS